MIKTKISQRHTLKLHISHDVNFEVCYVKNQGKEVYPFSETQVYKTIDN